VTERVVNQLLTEMDGLEQRNQVFVIAATNRPDIIDPAMLRPGRLDRILYVPLPCPEGRLSILQTLVRKSPLDSDVNLVEIANHVKVSGFSGADLASLVREASVLAIEDAIPNIHEIHEDEKIPERNVRVSMRHFIEALHGIHPSVSESQQKRYDRMQKMLCRSRAAVQEDKESSEDVNIQDAVIQN
jgi:ribosome biogenesis ATPase